MRLDEPSWWYSEPPGAIAKLLEPVGALYGWMAGARYHRAKPYKSRLAVVCVGNFTAGGTGKTPLAIRLCELLEAGGHAPVALTRGYGGRLPGPYWVDAETDLARDVGDEALLLARTAPTLLARNRAEGAKAIENGPHAATVIVMDDGLQNPALAKDLTIAVVDGGRGIGNGRIFPAGPLRAALDMQLELADAVVVNEGSSEAAAGAADWLRHRFAGPVLKARTVPAAGTDWLRGLRVVAWAGIGAPARFFSLIETMGATIVHRAAFPDHYNVTQQEARRLVDEAASKEATLVTTEKDMARLGKAEGAVAELVRRSRTLPVKLAFAQPDAERLAELVAAAVTRRAVR